MRIHFIGIGGIGVSALATYYLAKDHEVSGSDLFETEITKALEEKGAHIHIGPHKAGNVPVDARMVIYSPAVERTNPEREEAERIRERMSGEGRLDFTKQTRVELSSQIENQLAVLSYPEALGQLTKEHYTIAISGTHGKSTTTSMIGLLLEKAGLDPTVIVGTKLKEFGNSNCRVGKSEFLHKGKPVLVIEADEHFASFMNYWPDMIVLTTIEADHLDYYKNIENILRSFQAYVSKLPEDGIIVANKDDKNVVRVASSSKRDIQYYSSKWAAARELRKIMQVPGEYNVANAHAALTVARALLVSDATSYAALAAFQGTWRRFETFALQNPVPYTLVSDYGHHPTEVRVTVEAARAKWPQSKLWLVFQPHQYQRTYYFFRDFANILARLPVDKLILADIYDVPGREVVDITDKVSSEKLAHEIQKRKGRKLAETVVWIPALNKIYDHLLETLEGGEVVMVMGAGSIYDLAVRLTGELQKGKIEEDKRKV
ncbi:MAG TPA: Mur ligase family protein [Candidatus Paceibacterota bacterium]